MFDEASGNGVGVNMNKSLRMRRAVNAAFDGSTTGSRFHIVVINRAADVSDDAVLASSLLLSNNVIWRLLLEPNDLSDVSV